MEKMHILKTGLNVSRIALGCMRINSLTEKETAVLVETALSEGINFFDHADIYGGGACEEAFGKAVRQLGIPRETYLLQSKCGICSGYFDFSKEHILSSVEGSLKRLGTDYLDVLLLHRPDTLMEPEEVAEAFDILYESGKVRAFGVSNQNPMQMALLQKFVRQPLCFNQLQLSLTNTTMIRAGLNVNMENESAVNRDGSVLEYCRLHDITIQPWSPLQYGFFEGVYLGNAKFPQLNQEIDRLAEQYQVPAVAIVFAFLLRHPAKMQPIAGTTSTERLRDIVKGASVQLTRPEWYGLFRAAGNVLP